MTSKLSRQLAAWLAVAGLAACSDSTTTLRQLTPKDASRISRPPIATVILCKQTGVSGQTYSFDPTTGGAPIPSVGLQVGDCLQIYQGAPLDVGVTESSASPDSIVAVLSGGTTAADTVKVVAQNNVLISPALGSLWTINVYNPLPPGAKTQVCKITGMAGQTYMFNIGIGFGPLTPLALPVQTCQYVFSAPTTATPATNVTATETSATPDSIVATLDGDLTGASTIRSIHQTAATVAASGTAAWTIKFFNPLPAPTATCVAITAVAGVAITPVTLVGSGGIGAPYTFSASGLPTGLAMSSTGTISGTPTVSGTFPYTVTITDGAGHSGVISCSVTVNPAPTASCVSITAVQGVAITPTTLTASGGTGTGYTFTASGLPAGLTMSSTGTISGAPAVNGTFMYTVTITDSAGNKGTFTCTIVVNLPPSTSCVSITAVQGSLITPTTLTGSGGVGGPYTFSAAGLPPGLTMSSTGTISGTPTSSGTFPYTVTVYDAAGNHGTFNCSITVAPAPSASCVSITAVQGSLITPVTLTASGGTGTGYTFSATGLPAGLTMSSTGTISGTPTVSGTFTYSVTITDSGGNHGTFTCSVTVAPPPSATCVSIIAWKDVPITPTTLTGSGGTGGPYKFTATGLPNGLTMSSSGTISGTPTASGTFTYTVTITDAAGHKGMFTCSITVNYDKTAPVCSVYESASPPYMTYQDAGSGIVRLDVVTNLNSNFNVTLTPTPTGTTFSPSIVSQPAAMATGTVIKFPTGVTSLLKVSASRIDTKKSAQLTVKATDAAGNSVSCDPIMTTVTKLKQDNGVQTFTNLTYDEHFVTIENGGLRALDINVNGTTFTVKRLSDDEVRTVDVSSAMNHNNKNTITITPKGQKGDTADLIIGPGT